MKQSVSMEELMCRIGMTEEMAACAHALHLSKEAYDRWNLLFIQDKAAFFEQVKQTQGKQYRQFFLKWYLLKAVDIYAFYQEKNIPDVIYFDTFRDITYWTENCMRDYGEIGLEQYNWLWRHVTGTLFCLGRLQYEIIEGEAPLNLHIPQGESLNYVKCKKSLHSAAGFFTDRSEAVCHSWLLAPALKELLPASSNILRFQSLFEILELDTTSREAEERVFHKLQDDPEHYPETTSLQRTLKHYLLSGRQPGSALGRVKLS